MEAAWSSETWVSCHIVAQWCNPEDHDLNLHCHKILKSYNMKTDLKEIRCENVDWSHLIHGGNQWQAVVNTVMILWFLQKAWDFLTSSCQPLKKS
jgi:hypothetical protein